MKPKVFNILAMFAIISTLVGVVGTQPTMAGPAGKSGRLFDSRPPVQAVPLAEAEALPVSQEPQIYIVQLADTPVANYRGGVAGLEATHAATRGERRFNPNSAASQAYLAYLEARQAEALSAIGGALGRTVEPVFTYKYVYNGFAIRMTPAEAEAVARLAGVVDVQPDVLLQPTTDYGPAWIGAPAIWAGIGGMPGTYGEGVIVGVLDTGINHASPSFADIGPVDGYDHTNPWGSGNYVGYCVTNPSFCNDKLIGAWDYVDAFGESDGPEDSDGHGSHTSSTAAGNVVTGTANYPTTVYEALISGVAPHANIIMYDVCYSAGCPNSATMAATDQAVVDGVDVINYSIGGGASDPWEDAGALTFLNARDAGVFVATSAGNAGPDPATMGSPGNAPWMLTVGASTHNRAVLNALIDMAGDGTPPADMVGAGVTAGYGPAPIVYAGDYPNPNDPTGDPAQCLQPYPAGTWTNGEIVICDRGQIARVQKGANVLAGGAGGMVLVNTIAEGEAVVADGHYLPAVHLGYSDGQVLKAWVATGTVHTATISGYYIDVDPAYADIMTDFSSRGPNPPETRATDIIKPDVTAPGTSIFAASRQGVEYQFMAGTSMASPHAAGAAALLRALYPSWTPAQIQSALMSTAWTDLFKDDGVTEADWFDIGGGRVDLTQAGVAGFVLDITTTEYEDADPGAGGDPATLNLPTLGQDQCLQTCSWTRTISSTVGFAVDWTTSFTAPAGVNVTVNPPTFTLSAYGTQVLQIEADVSSMPVGDWVFGLVNFEPQTTTVAPAHFSLAALPTLGIFPELVEIDTRRDTGSEWVYGLASVEIVTPSFEAHGLVTPTVKNFALPQCDDNSLDFPDIFFDNGADFTPLMVGADDVRLVAEILDTTSPDLDMIVFYDADDDGTPEYSDTQAHDYCQSAAGGPWEFCDIMFPDAGRWFVAIINYTESANPPDPVSLGTAIVGVDEGNMWVEGPSYVPELTPYDVQVYWNEPAMEAGDTWYGAFTIVEENGGPIDIATIPVNIYRHEDDVVKTANTDWAFYGDTVTYTIVVRPNITPEDLYYMITDTIPAGLTYVPGSAQASEGTVNVATDTLTWEGTMYAPAEGTYMMTTSNSDPNCAVPLANSGAYLNLAAYGINPNATIQGDTIWFSAFASGSQFGYWDNLHTGINFTDDGMAFFSSTPGSEPWVNQDIPNPADPNNLLAMFWNDWEVVYQAGTRGVSLATLGGTGPTSGAIIEYDDVQPHGVPTQTIDFEVFKWRTDDSALGDPDLIFAYDNINLDTPITVGTIGVENALGTAGVRYAYNDAALETITNGMAICFDWFIPSTEPVTITYQVTVDEPGVGSPLTNQVCSITDNDGDQVACSGWDLYVLGEAVKEVSDTLIDPGDLITYTITLTAGPEIELWTLYDDIPDGFSFVSVDGATYDAGTNSISWSGVLGMGQFTPTESFEGTFPPAGWTRFESGSDDPGWQQSSVAQSVDPHTGTYAAYHNDDNLAAPSDAYLVTPRFAVPAGGGELTFWQADYYQSYYDYHGVWVTTDDNPDPFTASYTEVYSGDVTSTWVEQVIDLSAYAGQEVYLAFDYRGDWSDEWYIDDVTFPPVDLESNHVITLVLQGEVPGAYVNVAHINTQGIDFWVEAPEVVIYGPVPTWEKEVWIDGVLQTLPGGSFEVVDGSQVVIVDRVSVDFNDAITFTLEEEWTDSLELVDVAYSDGVIDDSTPGYLSWDVSSGLANTWYVITKTFVANDDYPWTDYVTETLTVEGYPPILEADLEFDLAARISKEAGADTAIPGDTIPYTITLEFNPLTDLAELEDVLPAGLEYVSGTLQASYGTAWYDSGTIYWSNTAGKTITAIEPLDVAPTAKEAPAGVGRPASYQSDKSLLYIPGLNEGFEGGVVPPTGWTHIQTNPSKTWQLGDTPWEGSYNATVLYDYDQDEWLISPYLNPSAAYSGAWLDFWSFGSLYWCRDTYNNCDLNVWLLFDDQPDVLLGLADNDWSTSWVYAYSLFDLTPYLGSGPFRIGFQYLGDDGAQVGLDAISVYYGEPTEVNITFEARVTAVPPAVITNTASLTYHELTASADHVLTVVDEPITGLTAHNDSPTMLGETTTLWATVTGGTNVVYEWALGDGEAATGQTVMHIYPAVGTYTATVTATNGVNFQVATTVVTIGPRLIYLPLVTRRYAP